ncbi:MAG: hypothetical protein JWP48_5380 [Actinoallomurus sp.]|nr:hypothetical protein [Actinoallomurus sp.]
MTYSSLYRSTGHAISAVSAGRPLVQYGRWITITMMPALTVNRSASFP